MSEDSIFNLALISMPWAIFNRPSVQLGALKAYASTQPDLAVQSYHPYLNVAREIGIPLYNEVALSGWAGEAIFAALVFPEIKDLAEKLYAKSLSKKTREEFTFKTTLAKVEKSCKDWLVKNDLSAIKLAGFSICFSQLLASLYLSRLLKARYPQIQTVYGGSACCGRLGESLQENFAEIDYLIDGEGEQPLVMLCRYLTGKEKLLPATVIGGKRPRGLSAPPKPLDLNDLPVPDYQDYSDQLRDCFPDMPVIPELPVEFSRGCWWNRCSFCNLNIQWQGYRFKTEKKMADEILYLAKKWESLDFAFTDNALPPKEADKLFARLSQTGLDLSFFAEVRTKLTDKQLRLYRRGGLTVVQAGIESLSNSLLAKMRKGASVLDNLVLIKRCYEAGIALEANLILEFPSSTKEEVDETLQILDYLLPFPPLALATFFLGYGSPIAKEPKAFAMDAVLRNPKYRSLFPTALYKRLDLPLLSFRGDRGKQKRLWQPVRDKIKDWERFHQHHGGGKTPPLSYRDGGTFLVIKQKRANGPALRHRLKGLSRKIYLACASVVSMEELLVAFPQVDQSSLQGFLQQLAKKRLIYREKDRVLALAIPEPKR